MFFSILTFFTVSRHFPGPTVCGSHFTRLSVFSPYSRSYSVQFSVFLFFSVSCHIPCHRVFVSHFTRFSDSRHNSGPTVCISHFFLRFSLFLSIFHVLHCVFLILQFFQCFSPYSRYYNVSFSIFC